MNKFFHGSSILSGSNTTPGIELSPELKKYIPVVLKACKDYGLDFFPTVVHKLTYDEISEIASYGGFPVRYPHWSFGMEYEQMQRGYEHGDFRIYELVINSDPTHIYCLHSNSLSDDLTVVAHATGHNDFFKNNIYFTHTNRRMVDKMANHGARIRSYMTRWGKEKVSEFIDHVRRLDTLIDGASILDQKEYQEKQVFDYREYKTPQRIPVQHNYMDDYINTPEYIKKQKEQIAEQESLEDLGVFKNPTRDIMKFIRDKAPLKYWQADIVSMLYDEAIYFHPQRITKVANEGHACLTPDSYIFTDEGILTMQEVYDRKLNTKVSDGSEYQDITNHFKFENRKIVKLITRRGLTIAGADNHRIWTDGEWKELKDFQTGDKVNLLVGQNIWSKNYQKINYFRTESYGWREIAKEAGCSFDTIRRNRNGEKTGFDEKINSCFEKYTGLINATRRKKIKVPSVCNEKFASFLGYLIGDGNISKVNRAICLTSGDMEQIKTFCELTKSLFGLTAKIKTDNDGRRHRAMIYSKELEKLLLSLGLTHGFSARRKTVPEIVLKSPKSVVAAFIRSYFDCDGYGGKHGVILSSSSVKLIKQTQLLLLNFGILSRKSKEQKGNYHLYVTGMNVGRYLKEIGFGLERKQNGIINYVKNKKFYKKEELLDEVFGIEESEGTVIDITVNNTHKYYAEGVLNHNSFIDYEIMARQGLISLGQKTDDAEIINYAIHKMGVLGGKYSMNPYKLGFYLLLDIEERWNKGRFGDAYDKCKDYKVKENWDTQANLGKEKILEVRKLYNDFNFINEFFTEEFCRKNEFFLWKKDYSGQYVIETKDYKKVKSKLLESKINGGLPEIVLVEDNFKGNGSMLLEHNYSGNVLDEPNLIEVLASICYLWHNEVYLISKDKTGEEVIYHCKEPNANTIYKIKDRNKIFNS